MTRRRSSVNLSSFLDPKKQKPPKVLLQNEELEGSFALLICTVVEFYLKNLAFM